MKVYQVRDLAEMMGTTERWVRMMLAAGDLPGKKIGRRWYCSEDELGKFFGIDGKWKGKGRDWSIDKASVTVQDVDNRSRIERLVAGEEVGDE